MSHIRSPSSSPPSSAFFRTASVFSRSSWGFSQALLIKGSVSRRPERLVAVTWARPPARLSTPFPSPSSLFFTVNYYEDAFDEARWLKSGIASCMEHTGTHVLTREVADLRGGKWTCHLGPCLVKSQGFCWIKLCFVFILIWELVRSHSLLRPLFFPLNKIFIDCAVIHQ